MFYSYSESDRIKGCGIIYSIKFGVDKIKKLYLLHIVTMLLAMPWLVKVLISGDILNSIMKIVFNICLLQAWIPRADFYFSLNGVSWYLSVSLFLYVTFPFVLRQIEKYDRIQTAIVAMGIIYSLQIIMFFAAYCVQIEFFHGDELVHWFVYVLPLSRLGDFVIGCNLGYVFLKMTKKNAFDRKNLTLMESGVIIIILIQMTFYIWMVTVPEMNDLSIASENWWGYTVLWTISSCALIYLFAINNGMLSKYLTNKSLIFIGDMSANAFLIHQMVYRYLDFVEMKFFDGKYDYANILMCFLITIVSAYMWNIVVKSLDYQKTIGRRLMF